MPEQNHELLKSLGRKPRTGKVKVCKQCNKEFYVPPSKGISKSFCSFACYTEYQRRTRIVKKCLNCGRLFQLAPSRLKHEGAKFCTHRCSTDYITRTANKIGEKVPTLAVARKRQASKKKGRKRSMDNIVSVFVRQRDGKCLHCGSTNNLQCSHTIPRTYLLVRYDLDNCITLCYRCHMFWWHKHPIEAGRWFEKTFPGVYDSLLIKAHSNRKIDWEAEWIRLKELQDIKRLVDNKTLTLGELRVG